MAEHFMRVRGETRHFGTPAELANAMAKERRYSWGSTAPYEEVAALRAAASHV